MPRAASPTSACSTCLLQLLRQRPGQLTQRRFGRLVRGCRLGQRGAPPGGSTTRMIRPPAFGRCSAHCSLLAEKKQNLNGCCRQSQVYLVWLQEAGVGYDGPCAHGADRTSGSVCAPREAQVEDVVGTAWPLRLRAHRADGLPAAQQAASHVGACAAEAVPSQGG